MECWAVWLWGGHLTGSVLLSHPPMSQLIPCMSSSTGSVFLNAGTCKSSFAGALARFWLCLQQPEGIMAIASYSK